MFTNQCLIVLCFSLYITRHIAASDNALFTCTQPKGDRGFCVPTQDCPNNSPGENECRVGVCCNAADYIKSLRFKKINEQCDKIYRQLFTGPPPAITGGTNSLAQEFPHMAVLGYGQKNETTWGCGGSLITENFVLTAAHCISSAQLGPVQIVRVGDLNLKSTTDRAEPQDIKVKRRIQHPEYKRPSKYNDIALLELENPARITLYVRPACINTEPEITEKTWVVTGWGTLGFKEEAAEHLQKAELREYRLKECVNYFDPSNRYLNKGIDDATQICAGYASRDTCQGDSGGPLQIESEYYSLHTIIGITSFGKACGLNSAPGVYTRVSAFADWIQSVVWSQY